MGTVGLMFIVLFVIVTFFESAYLILKNWHVRGLIEASSIAIVLVTLLTLTPIAVVILSLSVKIIPFVGLLLFLNGLFMLKRESLSIANSLSLIVGICLMISKFFLYYYTFSNKLLHFLGQNYLAMCYFFLWSFFLFTFYIFWIGRTNKNIACQTIIVLGCGLIHNKVSPLLRGRLNKAIELHQKNPSSQLIVSGGQGKDEEQSEASAMYQYLIAQGIDSKAIILEDKSRNTYENMLFSKEKTKATIFDTVFVTSNYHVLRASFFSKEVGAAKRGVGGKVALYFLPSALLREFIACILISIKLMYNYFLVKKEGETK